MTEYFSLIGFGPGGWGDELAVGTLVTISVAILGFLIGAVLGAVIAWARMSRSYLFRVLGELYTTILRGVPDLLVIYLFYFGGSAALGGVLGIFGHRGFVNVPSFAVGAVALGVVSAAYQAEVYRSSYNALSKGELEAARAVGMHRTLMFRRIVVPQLLRHAIPGLANIWLLILKESALISVTGLVEIMRTANVAAGSTRRPFDFFITACLIYLGITFISTIAFSVAEKKSRRGYRKAI